MGLNKRARTKLGLAIGGGVGSLAALGVLIFWVLQGHNAALTEIGSAFAQLVRLFQNLLGNAIKFRGNEAPRIHVGGEKENGECVIFVRDNGIGIDPQESERIFEISRRLHGHERPGTGIGLSICRKIVKRHRGSIWVESQPGQGATFYFTLKADGDNGR